MEDKDTKQEQPNRLHNDSQHYLKCDYRWQEHGHRFP